MAASWMGAKPPLRLGTDDVLPTESAAQQVTVVPPDKPDMWSREGLRRSLVAVDDINGAPPGPDRDDTLGVVEDFSHARRTHLAPTQPARHVDRSGGPVRPQVPATDSSERVFTRGVRQWLSEPVDHADEGHLRPLGRAEACDARERRKANQIRPLRRQPLLRASA